MQSFQIWVNDLDEQFRNLEEGYEQVRESLPSELTNMQTMLGDAVVRVRD